jgi:hypothetical protein
MFGRFHSLFLGLPIATLPLAELRILAWLPIHRPGRCNAQPGADIAARKMVPVTDSVK